MNFQYIKPRIKPIYPVYQLNDELFRIGAQLSITTEFEDPEGKLLELVKVLDGREMAEIVKHMINTFPDLTPEDVVDGLDILSAENLIEETPNKVLEYLDERYHPNISYFSRYMPYDRNPMDIQEKISSSSILLLGLGGGGSNILTLLSGLGTKTVRVVDYDRVERGNLGRQLLYRESDLGKLKVYVAVNALREMNSTINVEGFNKKIETPEDVLEFT